MNRLGTFNHLKEREQIVLKSAVILLIPLLTQLFPHHWWSSLSDWSIKKLNQQEIYREIHLEGLVRKPGIIRISSSDTLEKIIRKVGGPTPGFYLAQKNRGQIVADMVVENKVEITDSILKKFNFKPFKHANKKYQTSTSRRKRRY